VPLEYRQRGYVVVMDANVKSDVPLVLVESTETHCSQCQTRNACIAAKVPEDRLDILPRFLRSNDRIEAGTYLCRAGDLADRQYHVRSGMFKSSVLNAQGDEFITAFHLPGDIIGGIHQDGAYVESAIALETSSVCELKLDVLGQAAEPLLVSAVILHMCEKARDALDHRIALSQSSAQARFAAFCIHYAQKLTRLGRCAVFLPTPMSRTDLANCLGMTLESLSRVISKLNAAGVIQASRDHIDITEPDTLRAFALHTTL